MQLTTPPPEQFATHPFDVGDLVLIDTDWLFVKEFGLVSTVFRRVDGQELIAPNALREALSLYCSNPRLTWISLLYSRLVKTHP